MGNTVNKLATQWMRVLDALRLALRWFLKMCLALLNLAVQIFIFAGLIIKVILEAGIKFVKFFFRDKEVGKTKMDAHNMDDIIDMAEEFQRKYERQ